MIKELIKKRKRFEPILKIKKIELDREVLALERIKAQHVAAYASLMEKQRQYIEGVDTLNKLRQECDLTRLMTFECGLDSVKMKWHEAMQALREIQAEERFQMGVVLEAQKSLKSIEKMIEKYREDSRVLMEIHEQKELDEIATKKFNGKIG
jgi:flagellar export protein FliJ